MAKKPDHEHGQWDPDYGHGMQFRPHTVEVMCSKCMVTLDVAFNEKVHREICPSCQHTFTMAGRHILRESL
jgi:hypothetical protein